jgi:hypothetical protein
VEGHETKVREQVRFYTVFGNGDGIMGDTTTVKDSSVLAKLSAAE